ncbi:MAG: sugar phosphate nucleotidyltransferase, partial [Rickettsiales bacterium]
MSKEIMPKIAMVMAAGFGTRMRPLTDNLPKPLIPVLKKPLIDYSLDFLAVSGISEAIVNSHYLAELLEVHLAARSELPHIHNSREDVVLETGGGVKNALKILDELSGDSAFFVINSDVICINGNIPALHRLWQCWDDSKMDALLLLH